MKRRQPITPRLAKKEQKKLARQTALIFIFTLFLLGGFIFFVLPNVVRVAFNVLDSDPIAGLGDTVPPQIPILSAPVNATHSAEIKISGFGEAGSEVVLVLSGEEADKQQIDEEGKFEFMVELTEGENSIATYAIDEAKNESIASKSYSVLLDSEAPTLEIESPEAGSTITLRKNQLTTIKGKTESKAKVYVGGKLTFADFEGAFSTTYNLSEGENKIEIEARDSAGNMTKQELVVNFSY
jgi:uncharacterized protein YfaP (DUF2135 family)